MRHQLALPPLVIGKRMGPFEVPEWGDEFIGYHLELKAPAWPSEPIHVFNLGGIEIDPNVLTLEVEVCRPIDQPRLPWYRRLFNWVFRRNAEVWRHVYTAGMAVDVWRESRNGPPTDTIHFIIPLGHVQQDGQLTAAKTHPQERVRIFLTAKRAVVLTLTVEGIPCPAQ